MYSFGDQYQVLGDHCPELWVFGRLSHVVGRGRLVGGAGVGERNDERRTGSRWQRKKTLEDQLETMAVYQFQ